MSRIKNSQDIIKAMVVESDSDENIERDFLIRENANNVYGISLLSHKISEYEHERYLFENIISKEAKDLYDDGVVYIHDKSLRPYCVSIDLKQIALEGIPTRAKNMNASKPTKSFYKFMRHISNAVVVLSSEISGAIMLANMSTILGSYLKYNEEHDIPREITDDELDREMSSLVWELNYPLRYASQSAFTNCTMEFNECSPAIADEYIIIGGEAMLEKYTDLEPAYINRVNRALIKAMSKGAGNGKIFTFPLITVQFHDNFDKDNEDYKYLISESYKFGGFYGDNYKTKPFINSDFKDVNPLVKFRDREIVKSMCCMVDDTNIEIFDSMSSTTPIKTTLGMLQRDYATCDIDDDVTDDIFMDSVNKDTLKIERTKITGILKKKTNTDIIEINTGAMKTIHVTGDHPLMVKDTHTDEILYPTSDEFYIMVQTHKDRYLVPVMC